MAAAWRENKRGVPGGSSAAEAVVEAVDGGLAELMPDRDRPRAWTLLLDGAPQSHVDLDDPAYLVFEYQRRLGHVADLVAPARQARARPAPRRRRLHPRPLHRRHPPPLHPAGRRARRGPRPTGPPRAAAGPPGPDPGARPPTPAKGSPRSPDGWADLVIADVFSGARTPAHLTSDGVPRRRAPGPAARRVLRRQPRRRPAARPSARPDRHRRRALPRARASPPTRPCCAAGASATPSCSPPTTPLPVAELTRARSRATRTPAGSNTAGALADFTGGAAAVTDAARWPHPRRRRRSSADPAGPDRPMPVDGAQLRSSISTRGGVSCQVQNTETSVRARGERPPGSTVRASTPASTSPAPGSPRPASRRPRRGRRRPGRRGVVALHLARAAREAARGSRRASRRRDRRSAPGTVSRGPADVGARRSGRRRAPGRRGAAAPTPAWPPSARRDRAGRAAGRRPCPPSPCGRPTTTA